MTQSAQDATLAYYGANAESFAAGTVAVDFSALQDAFAACLPAGGRILDAGCGSGRDSLAFKRRGFRVTAMDGSPELCARAAALLGQEVLCARFEDYRPVGTFDGVWACASLLHLAPEAIPAVMRRLAGALAEGGVFYASFKYGAFRGMRSGRYFTDMDEAGLERLMAQLPGLSVAWTRVTADVRPGRENERWLNVLCRKKAGDRQPPPDPAP